MCSKLSKLYVLTTLKTPYDQNSQSSMCVPLKTLHYNPVDNTDHPKYKGEF